MPRPFLFDEVWMMIERPVGRLLLLFIWLIGSGAACLLSAAGPPAPGPPTIVLMMADDLGFSDIGCYGSEIPTPHLDALASEGVQFVNFSNTSRCCPSRASLLTGMYSHRVGMGDMNHAGRGRAYRGELDRNTRTLAERLSARGYSTAMVGKWHLTLSKTIDDGPNGTWPLERGFDRFYGSMEGAKNYFRPTWFFDQREEQIGFDGDFFYTDAIAERAAEWIRNQPAERPLFLYVAFYAPHFPLQAPETSITRHLNRYAAGWDVLRAERHERQKRLGIVPEDSVLPGRPAGVPAWSTLNPTRRSDLQRRMATYAAQVTHLDSAVGTVMAALSRAGRSDQSLVFFLSDNGAASSGGLFGAGPADRVGSAEAPIQTTYGKGWATVSNTPFREHKADTHEGGVMAPLIVHWPGRLSQTGVIRNDNAHIIDIAPTCLAATRSPDAVEASPLPVLDGIDLLAHRRGPNDALFYEHKKSRAVRRGSWKLVNQGKTPTWELYDLSTDRTERQNRASTETERLSEMSLRWKRWAESLGVETPKR